MGKLKKIGIGFGIVIVLLLVPVTVSAQSTEIPTWVKGVANFWVEGNISDQEFGEAISFLIEQNIIQVELPSMNNFESQKKIEQLELENSILKEQNAEMLVKMIVVNALFKDNPLKVCINDRETPYKIKVTLELFVDGQKANIPANVLNDEECQRSMYTLTNDGTIYAEWEEEFPFEIGHFLWMWDFPFSDMDESKSVIYVNGEETSDYVNYVLEDGDHYKAMFVSKVYDQ